MKILEEKELFEVNGGGSKIAWVFGVLGITALIAGIVDGLLRPLKCNK